MREFLQYLVKEMGLRKVVRITGVTETTLRKYMEGGEIRPSIISKMYSNIEIWTCTHNDKWIDACCGSDFIYTKRKGR